MGSATQFSGAKPDSIYKGEQFFGLETDLLIKMMDETKRNFNSDSYDPYFLTDIQNELDIRFGKTIKRKFKT